ncbi:MAG TPA: hypothetical protein VNM90_08780 [Haliangium sp.]|nr:hypothetical protein [Haliangium sp.]
MAGPARAQEAEPDATPAAEPDTAGEDARSRAERLFAEGNQLVEKYRLARAVEKYRQALEHWDHPAIHFNLAKALHGLGRPLEAYRHAELALQGGPDWLGAGEQGQENHDLILELQNELRRELAAVIVTSAERGLQVVVDSERIGLGSPAEQIVLPGAHRMSAQKRGHSTLSESFMVRPGESVTVTLSSHRPLAPWRSWAATGGGLALGIAGSLLCVHASNSRDELERRAVEQCRPNGCSDTDAEALASDWSSADLRWRIGLGSIAVGAGAATIGGFFLVRNWQRELRMTVIRRGAVSLTPAVSPALTGVTATLSF